MSSSEENTARKPRKKPRVQRIRNSNSQANKRYDFFDRSNCPISLTEIKANCISIPEQTLLNVESEIPDLNKLSEKAAISTHPASNFTPLGLHEVRTPERAPIHRRKSLTPPPISDLEYILPEKFKSTEPYVEELEELEDSLPAPLSFFPETENNISEDNEKIVIKIENVTEDWQDAIKAFKVKTYASKPILNIMEQVATRRNEPASDIVLVYNGVQIFSTASPKSMSLAENCVISKTFTNTGSYRKTHFLKLEQDRKSQQESKLIELSKQQSNEILYSDHDKNEKLFDSKSFYVKIKSKDMEEKIYVNPVHFY